MSSVQMLLAMASIEQLGVVNEKEDKPQGY
jgi:hypothetical protein